MIKKLFLALTIVLITASPVWADVKIMKCNDIEHPKPQNIIIFLLKDNKVFVKNQHKVLINPWAEIKGTYKYSGDGKIKIYQNFDLENNFENSVAWQYKMNNFGHNGNIISVNRVHLFDFTDFTEEISVTIGFQFKYKTKDQAEDDYHWLNIVLMYECNLLISN